jgi:hypothetical protein
MKRKIIAILVLSILCMSSFSFAGDEDYPVILKMTEIQSVALEDQ